MEHAHKIHVGGILVLTRHETASINLWNRLTFGLPLISRSCREIFWNRRGDLLSFGELPVAK